MKPNLPQLIKSAERAAARLNAAIDQIKGGQRDSVAAAKILRVVAEHYQTTPTAIKSPVRTNSLCWPRFVAAYFCQHAGMTLEQIGQTLGGRDHGAALHGVRRVIEEISVYPKRKEEIDAIAAKLHA